MAFPREVIPDDDKLFSRIHPQQFPGGKPSSAAFDKENLSVNWAKYQTPEGTTKPNSVAVVALVAGECRKIGQKVEHAPIEPDEPDGPNQAHSEIRGKKSYSIKCKLRDMAVMVWQKPGPA